MWATIAIPIVVVLMIAVPFLMSKLASRPLTPAQKETQLREIEDLKARRTARPWATDPVANAIEWTGTAAWMPTPGAGALHLRTVSESRVELQSRQPVGCCVAILLFAAAAAGVVFLQMGSLMPAVLALFLGMSASFVLWFVTQLFGAPIVFDKSHGMFAEGRGPLVETGASGPARCRGRIADIYALQMINAYRVKGGDMETQTYNTFELNLVMKDHTRINVSSHDDGDGMRRDATLLATFLGKPLWDAC